MARYNEAFALWLDPFADDLRSPDIEHGERLERVAGSLVKLIEILDAEKLYVGRV